MMCQSMHQSIISVVCGYQYHNRFHVADYQLFSNTISWVQTVTFLVNLVKIPHFSPWSPFCLPLSHFEVRFAMQLCYSMLFLVFNFFPINWEESVQLVKSDVHHLYGRLFHEWEKMLDDRGSRPPKLLLNSTELY